MSAPVVPPPALAEDAIRRLLVERIDERRLSVGMVVGITEANSHRFVAHGCRDARGGGPVNEKTLFEIGSITKLFTALLLSDMANRGEVRLDEPVAELLPAGTRVSTRDGKAIRAIPSTPVVLWNTAAPPLTSALRDMIRGFISRQPIRSDHAPCGLAEFTSLAKD